MFVDDCCLLVGGDLLSLVVYALSPAFLLTFYSIHSLINFHVSLRFSPYLWFSYDRLLTLWFFPFSFPTFIPTMYLSQFVLPGRPGARINTPQQQQ